MRYVVFYSTNVDGAAIAEFDDLREAENYINYYLLKDKEKVASTDTDPRWIHYYIADRNCPAKEDDPDAWLDNVVYQSACYYDER